MFLLKYFLFLITLAEVLFGVSYAVASPNSTGFVCGYAAYRYNSGNTSDLIFASGNTEDNLMQPVPLLVNGLRARELIVTAADSASTSETHSGIFLAIMPFLGANDPFILIELTNLDRNSKTSIKGYPDKDAQHRITVDTAPLIAAPGDTQVVVDCHRP